MIKNMHWCTRYSCPSLMKLESSRQTVEKCPNIKFHENQSTGSRVVPCDRRTDITKLLVAVRNFANPPEKEGKIKRT